MLNSVPLCRYRIFPSLQMVLSNSAGLEDTLGWRIKSLSARFSVPDSKSPETQLHLLSPIP